MDWEIPISNIAFIGPVYANRLKKLEITSIRDLLYHAPSRYEDYSRKLKISELKLGETATVQGKIDQSKNVYTKYGKQIQTVSLHDTTGNMRVFWFNQPFIVRQFSVGKDIALAGQVVDSNDGLTFSAPDYELLRIDKPLIHVGRLVPIYPETAGVSSKWLRSRIYPLLESAFIKEFLPNDLLLKYGLSEIRETLIKLHFPLNIKDVDTARKRLAFEELFGLQLQAGVKRREWQRQTFVKPFHLDSTNLDLFKSSLPFTLTLAQLKVIREIAGDLKGSVAMNRMLQGDVGSGKTIVAAYAAYVTFLNRKRTLFMSPTEILAEQHYNTLSKLFADRKISVNLQTGSVKQLNPKALPDILIGTHALLTDTVKIDDIGLVIIDEQHKFGVRQRSLLRQKGSQPHVLTMTATPIPRTIALTLYGELDLSVIDEMPHGRIVIKTWVVPPEKRQPAYAWIAKKIHESGRSERAFIVCPFIEPSESLGSVRTATTEFKKLQNVVFPEFHLGLLHGRLKQSEKAAALQKFQSGDYDILVTTPVVEVGIDIPEATIIVIEAAERFGLAQLHQLRGRVGRSDKPAFCLLFSESTSEKTSYRLKFMERNFIGSEIAEFDMRVRGAGSMFGTAQHGKLELKFNPILDLMQIEKARQEAEKLLLSDPDLSLFPGLKQRFLSGRIGEIAPD